MKIGGRRVWTGRLPLMPLLFVGILLGGIAMNCGKELLLDQTGLLDESALYHMKYMSVDKNTFFCYVLGIRLKSVLLLAIMATTYLGLAVIGAAVLWYGASMGMFLAAVVIRYGMKGVLFAIAGVFPQYLLYVPAMIFLIGWCEQLCRSIYFDRGRSMEYSKKKMIPAKLLQLGAVIVVVIIGSALESYVNPFIVLKLLKIF